MVGVAERERGAHGYPFRDVVGDNETPGSVGPVDINGLISVAPGAVSGATATPSGPGQVIVSWVAPSDPGSAPVSHYKVSWVPPGSRKPLSGTTEQTTAYLSGLEEGTYQFTIVAINPARSGPPTMTATVTVSDTPPEPPSS